MILGKDDMKYLEKDDNGNTIFNDNGKATKEELSNALGIDSDYFFLCGTHMIANYEELEKRLHL